IAAHLLEAGEGDVVFDNGAFMIAGSDRAITLKEVARAAWQPENLPPGVKPGLSGSAKWAPEACTYPYGTHICEVEIDSDTGEVRIDRYCVVDDVGVVINPLIVKGQIHGGIAQGAGQVLQERIVYDQDSGQCLTGSFMDYAMPRAGDLCAIEVGSIVTRTTVNPLGVKGVGEAGAVGALPAVMNAIQDALSPLRLRTPTMASTSFAI